MGPEFKVALDNVERYRPGGTLDTANRNTRVLCEDWGQPYTPQYFKFTSTENMAGQLAGFIVGMFRRDHHYFSEDRLREFMVGLDGEGVEYGDEAFDILMREVSHIDDASGGILSTFMPYAPSMYSPHRRRSASTTRCKFKFVVSSDLMRLANVVSYGTENLEVGD